jgi:hypothetical protein
MAEATTPLAAAKATMKEKRGL